MNNLIGDYENIPQVLKNPFDLEKITEINIHSRKRLFEDTWVHYGTVEFKNGSTKGAQEFEGKDIMDVLKQIYTFVNNL